MMLTILTTLLITLYVVWLVPVVLMLRYGEFHMQDPVAPDGERLARTREKILYSLLWPILCFYGFKQGWINIGRKPTAQQIEKHWRGHKVRTEPELQAMDCPFPAEPKFPPETYYERYERNFLDTCRCDILTLPTATNITSFGNHIRDGCGVDWRTVYCEACGGSQYSEKRTET